jgi:hypothetical protein
MNAEVCGTRAQLADATNTRLLLGQEAVVLSNVLVSLALRS